MTSRTYKSMKTYTVNPSDIKVDVHIDNEDLMEDELGEMTEEEIMSRKMAWMARL